MIDTTIVIEMNFATGLSLTDSSGSSHKVQSSFVTTTSPFGDMNLSAAATLVKVGNAATANEPSAFGNTTIGNGPFVMNVPGSSFGGALLDNFKASSDENVAKSAPRSRQFWA